MAVKLEKPVLHALQTGQEDAGIKWSGSYTATRKTVGDGQLYLCVKIAIGEI